MTVRPLSGIRITDLTFVVAGPVGTSILGALGAEIIKVESTMPRAHRAQVRTRPLTSFMELNHSKKGISLNLNLPEAKDVLKRLVAISDVVIDNFSPRVMRNFGLEYDDFVKVKPDIIVVSMPAFGRNGPYRDRISFGPGIDAMSGLAYLTGYPDSTPLKPGNYYCDYNAGALGALAVMGAVAARKRTGRGQFVEVAMRDGETQLIGEYMLDYFMNGRHQERAANRHPTMAPHNVYRCLGDDLWLAIAVETDEQWQALAGLIGRPELARDSRFASAPQRKQNEAALDEILSDWARDKDHIAAEHELQAAGVPASAVLTPDELAVDPQFTARNTFQEVTLWQGEEIKMPRPGWLAERANLQIGKGPEYSQHTYEVLGGLLDLSEAEIAHLAEIQAIVLPEYVP